MSPYYFVNILCRQGAVLIALYGSYSSFAFATNVNIPVETLIQSLPALSEPNDHQEGHFSLDPDELEIGYDTKRSKWLVTAAYSDDDALTFSGHYGFIVNRRLASGASLSFGKTQKEVLLNEIFSPQKHVRLRFSMGYLLDSNNQDTSSTDIPTTTQNSYLLEVKRSWGSASWLSDVGLTVYNAHAKLRGGSDMTFANHTARIPSQPAVSSASLQGYAMNIWLTPSPLSQLGFDLGAHRRIYYRGGLRETIETAGTYSVHFSHYLKNCTRLESDYSTDRYESAMHVKLRQRAWSIGLSAALSDDGTSPQLAIYASYTLPLGRSRNSQRRCSLDTPISASLLPPIEDAVSRPDVFPAESVMPMIDY